MAAATVNFKDQAMTPEASFPLRFESESLHIDPEISPEDCFEGIVGRSRALQKVLEQIAIVAPTGATVLLHGETVQRTDCELRVGDGSL